MRLTITTWNINSVRLRIDSVAKFIKAVRPDVLCLQETKCPDDKFPRKRFRRLGYEHVALNGQKGYHGVVVISRLPFERFDMHVLSAARPTAGTSARCSASARACAIPSRCIISMCRPAATRPIRTINPKFAHKLSFLDEMRDCEALRCNGSARMVLVGDLNVAPLEHDVWSHKQMLRSRLAHADRVREADAACNRPAAGSTPCAGSCRSRRSSTLGGATVRPIGRPPTRAAASTISGSRPRSPTGSPACKVLKGSRGWTRPSDHVPVTATLDV